MVVRGSSFLEPGLVKAGIVKRVDSVENADLCYWDAQARTFHGSPDPIQTKIPSPQSTLARKEIAWTTGWRRLVWE